jgi:hypothetical protein
MIIQWNKLATFNVVMASRVNVMAYGTVFTEQTS